MPDPGDLESSAHRAYSSIRKKIQQGELRSGEVVSEAGLARALRMSRTPVRDAISRLTLEGLLVSMPSRGTVVASLGTKDVVEIYRLREVLEGLACNLAAANASPADMKEFERIMAGMRRATLENDLKKFPELDAQFHLQIVRCADNARLSQFLDALWATTPLQSYQHSPALTARRITVSVGEHQTILDAIREGNSKQAEEAMYAHARSALQDLTRHILGRHEHESEAQG